jgi:hypothetical protein
VIARTEHTHTLRPYSSSSTPHAVGIPELITSNLEDYQTLALKLARDRALLAEIKAKLVRNRNTYPLFDTVRFTRPATLKLPTRRCGRLGSAVKHRRASASNRLTCQVQLASLLQERIRTEEIGRGQLRQCDLSFPLRAGRREVGRPYSEDLRRRIAAAVEGSVV